MELHGVQNLKISGNQIANAKPAQLTITIGNPEVAVSGNTLIDQSAAAVLTTVDLR